MSEENIPQKVDPFRFADHAIRLQGMLHIRDMLRLSEYLHNEMGEVKVDIAFSRNEQGISFLAAHVTGALQLQCQRCMESYVYDISSKIRLALVRTEEEAEDLPQGYDSIIVNDDILSLPEVIEDELIVSLPVVPMHNPKDCKVTLPLIIESEQASQVEKESPFQVIEFLRAKRDPK